MDEIEIVKSFLSHPSEIVVIGASNKSHRAGHYVPKFLQSKGFTIVPINPNEEEIFGEKSLSSLGEYEGEIKAALVYRNQEAAKETALDMIDNREVNLIWFPDNIISQKVATKAESNNVKFIQDRCPLRDYRTFIE